MKLVPKTEEERQNLISEARSIAVCLPVLEPMLGKRKEGAIKRLVANYRDGKHQEQMNLIAELYVIENMISELNAKLGNLNLENRKEEKN